MTFQPGYDPRRGQMTPGGLISRELQRGAVTPGPGPEGRTQGTTVGIGPAPGSGILVALPPVNFPPEGAYPVPILADEDVAPGASATILTFNVPAVRSLRVAEIGFGADDETCLRFLTWSLNINSTPAPGYNGVAATIGTISSPATIVLNVPGPATVTMTVTAALTANVTYRYIVWLSGWLYGQQEVR